MVSADFVKERIDAFYSSQKEFYKHAQEFWNCLKIGQIKMAEYNFLRCDALWEDSQKAHNDLIGYYDDVQKISTDFYRCTDQLRLMDEERGEIEERQSKGK